MEVDFSDLPELEPLTLLPLQGPLALHALILILATLVWFAELCMGTLRERKKLVFQQEPSERNWSDNNMDCD